MNWPKLAWYDSHCYFHIKLKIFFSSSQLHENPVGLISSPGYPFGYRPITCIYKIRLGYGKQVTLKFMDFHFTPFGHVCAESDDNLRIRGSIFTVSIADDSFKNSCKKDLHHFRKDKQIWKLNRMFLHCTKNEVSHQGFLQ